MRFKWKTLARHFVTRKEKMIRLITGNLFPQIK